MITSDLANNYTSLPARCTILGTHISAIHMDMALKTLDSWIIDRTPQYVCVSSSHPVLEAYDNPDLQTVLNNSGLTTPDGMPLVWLLRAYGHKHVKRVYGPDLMLAACQYGLSRRWRHYFYGGAAGIPERLAEVLCARFPGLQVVGLESPPFRPLTPAEDEAAMQRMLASGADIIWVGLGAPRQEFWMAGHVERLARPVLVGVGAAFDFLSGAKPQAPRFIQRSGLEWLYRFFHEPRRLWPRYRQYPRFAWLALSELIRRKRAFQ
jgi:N-acetylglucosaminyldiphosphoundecaprenol N-acetyl-beta-D-mannosaminyltransferase